jgi:hypothetical protein
VTVLEVDVDSERVSLKLKSETVNDVIGNAAVRETSRDDIVVRQEGKPEVSEVALRRFLVSYETRILLQVPGVTVTKRRRA